MAELYFPGTPGAGLIVALHGGLDDPRGFSIRTGLHTYGDPAGVLYLEAEQQGWLLSGRHWNVGPAENGVDCFGGASRDDVGYVLRTAERYHTGGPVLVTGFSEGSSLAQACAVVATGFDVATVTGGLVRIPRMVGAPASRRLLHLHGRDDEKRPREGGKISVGGWRKAQVPGVQAIQEYFGLYRMQLRPFPGGHEWPDFATAEIMKWWRG